jgi:lipopolysaccharide transport system ATP-binding protein
MSSDCSCNEWENKKEIAIRVSNLSKVFQIYQRPEDRLKQFVFSFLHRFTGFKSKEFYRQFCALNDINFEVKRGETVGVIGRNGAGKSTLLQIICGTLPPTSGEVEINGRVAAILELGSGFNPEFTGHQNIYMNAAILGLTTEEIDARYDEIVNFADIGDFVYQPVKMYSSGMVVRLAFAIQTQVEPDILIVDEALAVGDAKFQVKCFNRLKQLRDSGTSILLVTHSHEQIVTHCSSAMILDHGAQLMLGDPRDVVNRYLDLVFGENKKTDSAEKIKNTSVQEAVSSVFDNAYELSFNEDEFDKRNGYNPHEYRWGDRAATILDYYLSANGISYPYSIATGQQIQLVLAIKFERSLYQPIVGITIKSKEGVTVYGTNSLRLNCETFREFVSGGSVVQVQASFECRLAPGEYFISLGVATMDGEKAIPHDRRYDSIYFKVMSNFSHFGLINLDISMSAKMGRESV